MGRANGLLRCGRTWRSRFLRFCFSCCRSTARPRSRIPSSRPRRCCCSRSDWRRWWSRPLAQSGVVGPCCREWARLARFFSHWLGSMPRRRFGRARRYGRVLVGFSVGSARGPVLRLPVGNARRHGSTRFVDGVHRGRHIDCSVDPRRRRHGRSVVGRDGGPPA